MEPAKRRSRRGLMIFGGVLAIIAGGLYFSGIGPLIYGLWKRGIFEKREKRMYSADSMGNLKALHTAMMLYHESNDLFPSSAAWMDEIKNYAMPDDMDKKEAMKKFVRPEFLPSDGKRFGYAMNDACSAKFKDDLPEKGATILLFESGQTEWNAHGSPQAKSNAVTVDGAAVQK